MVCVPCDMCMRECEWDLGLVCMLGRSAVSDVCV